MIRAGSLLFGATLVMGVALVGCSGGGDEGTGGSGGGGGGGTGGTVAKDILDLVPRSNDVSGWTVDPNNPTTASVVAKTATTEVAVEGLIDGAAADFFADPYAPSNFAWQNYANSTLADAPDGARVTLYIIELPSAEQASGLYASLREASLYTRKVGTPEDWQDPTTPLVGNGSRIQDTGDTWWINFHKGNYYVEVNMFPSAGPAPDYMPGNANTKAEAFAFAQAVAAKM
jgi:hypothetical protein